MAWVSGLGDVWGDEGDGVPMRDGGGGGCEGGCKPCTGAQPGCHVGNCARGGGALAEATEEEGEAMAVLGSGVDADVGEGFGYPFKEAMLWEANEVEGEHLGFCRDSIEVFFFVFIDMRKVVLGMVNDVLDCEDIVEGEVSG